MNINACNYNSEAKCDDGSCILNSTTINISPGSYNSEISWDLVDKSNKTIISGGAPYNNNDICLVDGCYTLNMEWFKLYYIKFYTKYNRHVREWLGWFIFTYLYSY